MHSSPFFRYYQIEYSRGFYHLLPAACSRLARPAAGPAATVTSGDRERERERRVRGPARVGACARLVREQLLTHRYRQPGGAGRAAVAGPVAGRARAGAEDGHLAGRPRAGRPASSRA
jgi:hypothetical protein